MTKRQIARSRVTAGEALYILDRLIKEKRLSEADVARIVGEMHREIEDLEQRLAALRAATGSRSASSSRAAGARPARSAVSAEQRKSRQIQGEYMGLIRHIQGPARARMKKLASDHGREAAIKAMRDSLSA